ncbi:hypothetical protein AB0392_15690 [Nonomuraea angiospora]|uniref:hypothetical protein n=1 Tax=Nonomuraea angiospora TaxID=46172 RepID=UPI00344D130B
MTGEEPGEVKNEIALDGNCSPLIGLITSCRSMKIAKPCENCYITGVMPDLVFAGTDTGVNMDTGGMLHHVVNVNFSRWDVTCPPEFGDVINRLGLLQGGNERFFAAGDKWGLQCGDSERSVPAGYSDSHWTTTVPRSGTLVAVGGHAHDRSISVSLQNVTKNRYSCTSLAGYAPDSTYLPAGPGL